MSREVAVLLERCEKCGELRPTSMGVGDEPPVVIRWRFRKSETCDHMLVDRFEVRHPA
jgi:hypothetical protein